MSVRRTENDYLSLAQQRGFTWLGPLPPGAHSKSLWRCSQGHEWLNSYSIIKVGRGCPYCAGKVATEGNNLASVYPDLAKQWHPTKNDLVTPGQILPSSGKRYWWMCAGGHEWLASPNNRSKGNGCPYCAGRRVTSLNNLLYKRPDIAREWHPIRNGPLTPDQVLLGSAKSIWWQCSKGHEWQASVNNRANGRGCPFCANKAVSSENSLAATFPKIASEWHPKRNSNLHPDDVTWGSGVKIWWQCKYGHEWKTSIVNRTGLGTGCPKCSPQWSRLELRLFSELHYLFGEVRWREKIQGAEADLFLPKLHIAIEVDGHHWHQQKEVQDRKKGELFALAGVCLIRVREAPLRKIVDSDITFESREPHIAVVLKAIESLLPHVKVVGQRTKLQRYIAEKMLRAESEYQTLLAQLPGPIDGKSLHDKYPAIAAEWNGVRNGSLTPSMVSAGSSLIVWWKCQEGHEWEAPVSARRRTGCPYCAGKRVSVDRNLLTVFPELSKEWDFLKNHPIKPEDVLPHSGKAYWWRCSKGHEWKAKVDNRANGRNCPYCSGQLLSNERSVAVVCPNLVQEWHPTKNKILSPREVPAGSGQKIWWQCGRGHEWLASVAARKGGTGCPYCSGNRVHTENSLAAKHPELLSEWDVEANLALTPDQISHGSGRKVWWKCSKGHSWQSVAYSRAKGHGCPICAGKRTGRRVSA